MQTSISAPDNPAPIRTVAIERGVSWLGAGWRLFLAAPGVWLGITIVLLLALLPMLLGLLVFIPLLIGSIYASYSDIYCAAPTARSAV